jgi:hypothetical protein
MLKRNMSQVRDKANFKTLFLPDEAGSHPARER